MTTYPSYAGMQKKLKDAYKKTEKKTIVVLASNPKAKLAKKVEVTKPKVQKKLLKKTPPTKKGKVQKTKKSKSPPKSKSKSKSPNYSPKSNNDFTFNQLF